ncbi:P-loop containing nucleoside triphosphate hydrolase protein [Pavlovales sp. CCMP2436]|nr:P-loop containing nucleoside triphosphate hydrolase protein [Pavlovales sp. CCMP2436]
MERISVSVRIRPLNVREAKTRAGGSTWRVAGDSIAQLGSDGKGGTLAPAPGSSYTFDKIFDQSSQNADVYDAVAKDIVGSTFAGINGTIIAYGQTSSGKTHTMYGSAEEPGVVPLAIDAIFEALPRMADRLFLLRIYNDTVTDLISKQTNLAIREDFGARFVVKGLSEEVVRSRDDVFRLMAVGEAGRSVGSTGMNERSSRSHTVFQLTIESTSRAEHEGAQVFFQYLCMHI